MLPPLRLVTKHIFRRELAMQHKPNPDLKDWEQIGDLCRRYVYRFHLEAYQLALSIQRAAHG